MPPPLHMSADMPTVMGVISGSVSSAVAPSVPAGAAAGAVPAPASPRALTTCDHVRNWGIFKFGYLIVATLTAIIIWQLTMYHSKSYIAWGIAFIWSAICVPISVWDISSHVSRLASPLQVHYVRILMMVPIFAIESWLALRYTEQRHIFEALRSLYECITIQSFFRLIVDYFGGDRKFAAMLAVRDKKEATMLTPLSHPPLSWCVRPWRLDRGGKAQFVENCSLCISGYVITQVLVVIINLVAEYVGEAIHKDVFCEGGTSASCVYPYTTYFLLFWQCVAVYAIVIVYHEAEKELVALKAFPKLMLVKFVVFVSFWQSIVRGRRRCAPAMVRVPTLFFTLSLVSAHCR